MTLKKTTMISMTRSYADPSLMKSLLWSGDQISLY